MAQALAKPQAQPQTLEQLLQSRKELLSQVASKHLTADRLIKVTLVAVSRQPLLRQCTAISILQAVIQAAELGLEPSGTLGGAYLVPYKNEAKLIVGYRGLIDLARRSGEIRSVTAYVVRERDRFEFENREDGPHLIHKPSLDDDPGQPTCAYAIAQLRDGLPQVDVMSHADIERVRSRSKASANGPWMTDWNEMAKKTVVRRLCKYLPMSSELDKALELDARAEEGEGPALDILPEALPAPEASDAPQPKATRVTAVKDRLKSTLEQKRAQVPQVQNGQEPPPLDDADMMMDPGAAG